MEVIREPECPSVILSKSHVEVVESFAGVNLQAVEVELHSKLDNKEHDSFQLHVIDAKKDLK